ncbi:diguanylate cyclase [Nitratireductor aestuarii]|uniref:Diguanylate cyclase n=1 Tax=Nitratireductor aestuarii TaxID=1735103 RepID=A0A916RPT2_9HYPH|nr:EAL domain-containing protein [Nitratireductor aestuarii]GGA64606.1 diguanylate cyclase [Nitratireductor aestuarii]
MAKRADSDIPGEVYIQFVKSLYGSASTVLVGATSHMLVALFVYLRNGEPLFLAFAALFIAIGIIRYMGIRKGADEITDPEQARRLESEYVVRGAIQGLLLGVFGFCATYVFPDQFGQLGALALVLSALATVVGRNYGSSRVVLAFTVSMLAPLALALLLRGEPSYGMLAILMLPFGLIVIRSASDVRKLLVSAVLERKNADLLAQRFDRALNTMSHGLIMLNLEGCVVVANDRAAEHLGFRFSEQMIGRTLDALLLRGVAGALLNRDDFIAARRQLQEALDTGHGKKVLLHLRDGRFLEFTAREGKEELAVLTFEEVTNRVAAEEKIRHMARYDSLTGLPNRAYFQEMVRDFIEQGDDGRLCGLAIIDLDDFKSINDTMGHPVGDSLIYAVAERLISHMSDTVKIGRFGGDEFMLYIDHVQDVEDFSERFSAIFEEIRGQVEIAGHLLSIEASAGVVVFQAAAGDLNEVTVRADLALYAAKDAGKSTWRLFEEHMDAAFRTKQMMKSDLRAAIAGKQLHVMYQPIIDMNTLRVSSYEALCRWTHPHLGPISPAIFIPLAEEMGLITEISCMVLETACKECMKWPEHINVSVNLSAKDFHGSSVIDNVAVALANSSLAPQRLELEVTETALLDDKQRTHSLIKQLKKLGVCIALDDFGTGYSSLSYLHTLPLDRVKIDGSFLHDVAENPRSRKLLKSVVQLSRGLGLSVTVEGVETHEQLRLLQESARPDQVQGFLFGAALSPNGARAMADGVWAFEQTGRIDEQQRTIHK